jgi:hypothetical protein
MRYPMEQWCPKRTSRSGHCLCFPSYFVPCGLLRGLRFGSNLVLLYLVTVSHHHLLLGLDCIVAGPKVKVGSQTSSYDGDEGNKQSRKLHVPSGIEVRSDDFLSGLGKPGDLDASVDVEHFGRVQGVDTTERGGKFLGPDGGSDGATTRASDPGVSDSPLHRS